MKNYEVFDSCNISLLQAEPRAALNLASMGSSRLLKLHKNDVVLYAAKVFLKSFSDQMLPCLLQFGWFQDISFSSFLTVHPILADQPIHSFLVGCLNPYL